MESALERLHFTCMEEVTSETLKARFKESVVNTHPDRGGKDGDFDEVLSAYVYLTNVLKRMTGGRNGASVLHVDDVKQERDQQFVQELNNMMNDVFDQVDRSSHDAFNREFNEQFEKLHIREQAQGYEEWLKEEEKEPSPLKSCSLDEFQGRFETEVRKGKPMPTSLVLHLDEMALVSGPARGYTLIPKEPCSFTSEPEAAPEYTDLHDAYTSENTVLDKLPVYEQKSRTFEEILKERDMVYTTELDRDLVAIQAYEQRKMDEEKEHKKNITEYFKKTAASSWALPTSVFTKEFVKEC